eukprot:1802314-Prymnesium_polylepis.1
MGVGGPPRRQRGGGGGGNPRGGPLPHHTPTALLSLHTHSPTPCAALAVHDWEIGELILGSHICILPSHPRFDGCLAN